MRHAKAAAQPEAADAAGSASGSREPREAIGAPFFAADAVVDEEKSRRIVFLLYREQPRIVWAPIGALPFALKEAAFRDVGARVRRQRPGGQAERSLCLDPPFWHDVLAPCLNAPHLSFDFGEIKLVFRS